MKKWYIVARIVQDICLTAVITALTLFFNGWDYVGIKVVAVCSGIIGLIGALSADAIKEKIIEEELEKIKCQNAKAAKPK